jgi:predicted transcriptional regulator of viral defense system
MKSTESFAAIERFGKHIVTTSEAAVLWRSTLTTASKRLSRLKASGLVQEISSGVWAVGTSTPDILEVVPVLTAPYPSYVSMYSALFIHGMIDQIPRALHVVSLGRQKRVATKVSSVVIHRLQPELFGGYEGQTSLRAGVATAEKALFDTVVVLSARSGMVTLPEIDLPDSFDRGEIEYWSEKILASRVRTMTSRNLDRIIDLADAGSGSLA